MNTKTENIFLWGIVIFSIIAVSFSDPIIWMFIVEYYVQIAGIALLMALSAVISGLWYHRKGLAKGRSEGYQNGWDQARNMPSWPKNVNPAKDYLQRG